MNQEKMMDVHEVPKATTWMMLSLQHLFAMFGATILVPFLTGLSPAVALISSGTGTLSYLLITRGKIPAYLGSSFAFIVPITAASEIGGIEGAMVGSFLAGLVYGAVALLIKVAGVRWIMHILPPVVVGPVIIVIGLGLASTAVGMAMNEPSTGTYSFTHFLIAMLTLSVTILGTLFFKGFMKLIPILVGIVTGYTVSLFAGIVDTSGIKEQWNELQSGNLWTGIFEMPDFVLPFVDYAPLQVLNGEIILLMVPIAIVTIAEHIGDQMVLSKVAGKNFIEKPGLHRSIAGDGVATILASMLGGPPNTTYGENIGVLAITRVFSVFVVGGAAVIAICFGFIGMITAVIASVPQAVMGGVSILLFGIIASNGLRMLVDNEIDLSNQRNLIITSVIMIIGVGGASIVIPLPTGTTLQVDGMALAAITGIVLNLILPGKHHSYGNGSMFQTNEKSESDSAA
ncbi:uracil transporter [Pontibacillus halophilus JSM 076056 = DSM 19796]|uniref:Uracil transporter n=1 Tax=Pontibacillus halophilus JSM 076056 = DSM 19796 TaxID=1385510 RepID=A0A0A5GPY9_9BACI|nr:solute carrier family 23 protein [Pontibacillus halophilus]KGX93240.1 uracil transporter [Pontibacillus halophilus JSM 076056 = DSM 19796]